MSNTITKTQSRIKALHQRLAQESEAQAKDLLADHLAKLPEPQQTLLLTEATAVIADGPFESVSVETLVEEALGLIADQDQWQSRYIQALLGSDLKNAHRIRRWIAFSEVAAKYQAQPLFGRSAGNELELVSSSQFAYVSVQEGSYVIGLASSPDKAVDQLLSELDQMHSWSPVTVVDLDTGRRATATVRVELSAFEKTR